MEKHGRRIAAAISYRAREGAPRILALGQGREAGRIIARAREAGIAIVEDAPLAALLSAAAKPGDFVPPRCWEAVAGILAFVYKQETIRKGKVED
jgi:flagellar biosynthesis protein